MRGPDNTIISPLSDVVSPHVLEYSPRTTINSTSISQIHNQYSVELLEKCQQQHEYLLSLTNMNTASRILKPTSANIGRENYLIKYILSTLKEQGHQIFDRIDDLIGTLLRAAVVAAETFEAAVFAIFTDLMPLLFEYCFVSFYFLPISFVVVPMIDIIN